MLHGWKISGLLTALLTLVLILAVRGPAATPAEKPAASPQVATPTEASRPAAAMEVAEAAKNAPATKLAQAAQTGVNKLTFIGVQNPDQQAALTAVLAEYQKTHPNIDVEFELLPFAQLFPKIQANAAAKVPTDIILADGPNVWNFAYHGIIAPMDDWFDQDYVKKNW